MEEELAEAQAEPQSGADGEEAHAEADTAVASPPQDGETGGTPAAA
jgi:exoribonuclease-2